MNIKIAAGIAALVLLIGAGAYWYGHQTPQESASTPGGRFIVYRLVTTTFPDQSLVELTMSDRYSQHVLSEKTLVPSVHAALPDLSPDRALFVFEPGFDGLQTEAVNGRIYLWDSKPLQNTMYRGTPAAMIYAFDIESHTFQKLENAYEHQPDPEVVLTPDREHFLSIYDSEHPDDTQMLYLIDLRNDSAKVIGKLSGDESYSEYPAAGLTSAPYGYLNADITGPRGFLVATDTEPNVLTVQIFNSKALGEEDTRDFIRREIIPLDIPDTTPTDQGWGTYTNAQYGFTFMYPSENVRTVDMHPPSPGLFVVTMNDGSSMEVSIEDAAFDPNNIQGPNGRIRDPGSILIDRTSAYWFNVGNGHCGDKIVEMPLNQQTLNFSFMGCQEIPPFPLLDETLQLEILSTLRLGQ